MLDKMKKVKIKDIVNAFERCSDSCEQFLSLKTGEIILVFNDMFGVGYDECEEEREEIESNYNEYLRLPNQYEIHEYNIMEEFASIQKDVNISRELFFALNKKRPFRHFKDTINYLGIANEYYNFYREKLYEKAKQWCREHNIEYIETNQNEE